MSAVSEAKNARVEWLKSVGAGDVATLVPYSKYNSRPVDYDKIRTEKVVKRTPQRITVESGTFDSAGSCYGGGKNYNMNLWPSAESGILVSDDARLRSDLSDRFHSAWQYASVAAKEAAIKVLQDGYERPE